MGFLGDLANGIENQLNSQFGAGENTTTSLDATIDGQNVKYGSLGDFANQIDQSAERRYVEEGFLRRDPYNADPKQFEVLLQEPNATILVKKSMFSSVNENYRPDYMDADEILYFQAMKVLFQNKCNQISTLEKLSKIQKITAAVGNISDQLMSIIIGLTDDAGLGFNTGGFSLFGGSSSNGDISNYTKVIEKVRRVYGFNTTNKTTTWITDQTQQLFSSTFGTGTGVMELTNFSTLNTTVTTDMKSPGGFNFTIMDPYETMLITSWDIEKAIADATNAFYNNQTYQLGQSSAQTAINDAQNRLNQLRAARGASNIEVITAYNTVINRRVRAVYGTGIEINFTYNAGFGGIGGGVDVDPQSLQGGAVAGNDGLSTSSSKISGLGPDSNIRPLVPQSELSVFQQLIKSTYDLIQLQASSGNQFQIGNQKTNYARRKLNFDFCGKLIIQPMDIVHIYINSKSRWDDRLLDGLQNMFTGAGILQNLNNTLTNVTNQFNSLFNPSGNIQMQTEKSVYVGSDFPDSLWSLMRNQFINENEGTHVCAGIVESAPSSWQDGRFTISVTGRDNTAYFEMGKINFKPGVDVFNGAIFDPLTPFVSTFDTIATSPTDQPDLLSENKQLLGTSSDTAPPLFKFKLGPNAGQVAHSDNLAQDNTVDPVAGSPQKVYYAPDGLVYKWKEGIGVLTQFGSSLDINSPARVGNPSITKEPFAGQDVMNVISLLITGQPYNFDTYWRAVSNFDGFGKDPQSQQDAAHSFYAGLRTDLTKNNATWGNFVPFKNLVIDDQTYAAQMSGQINAINRNRQLDQALQQYADYMRQANVFAVAAAAAPNDPNNRYAAENLKAQALAKDLQARVIKPLIENLQNDHQNSGAFGSVGDPSAVPGTFAGPANQQQALTDAAARRLYRRQVNQLTRRMSYNVRANEDKNLFIVDDSYDKDYDILAYEESLSDGIKLYNNEFESVKDKISKTAELLNLEVYADTQGHIRVRSPQYNRMPSSIFYRMMYLKSAYNIQIYPQFLQTLFGNQIQTLTKRLEVLENQIRLTCGVLGFLTDADCIDFILNGIIATTGNQSAPGVTSAIEGTGEVFGFISNEGTAPTYAFTITDMSTIMAAANADTTNVIAQSLTSQATATKVPFSSTERYQVIADALSSNTIALTDVQVTSPTPLASNPRLNALIQAIRTATGQQISNDYFLKTTDSFTNGVNAPAGVSLDVFKITGDLQNYIRQRQQIIKLLYKAVVNSQEAQSLDSKSSNTANDLLTPGLYGNSNIPEIFEHMIEDETYDDYGPGSGTRYIIRRGQIRNLQITETPPDYTYIEVKGQLDPLLPNTTLPGELNNFPLGGNGLVTAAAVDYDLWRKYGFRQQSPINVPFLKDPNSQCAPYASMILSRARKNILRGSVTISGNEYMQPGEVIYLQDREMLFYVTSVKHSFTYGSGFTTTLDLAYGHTPGEYIPNTLDVIGKLLYSNADVASATIYRQSSALNDSNMGCIIKDPFMSDASGNATTQTGNNPTVINTGDPSSNYQNQYTGFNARTLNNILYQAAYLVNANATQGNTAEANVELRIYYDSQTPVNSDLQAFAHSVLNTLTQPGGPIQPFNSTTGTTPPSIPMDNISVVTVQLDDPTELSSPSQKALSMARSMVKQNNASGGGASIPGVDTSQAQAAAQAAQLQQQVRTNLYSYIVDCWLTIDQVETNVANSTTGV